MGLGSPKDVGEGLLRRYLEPPAAVEVEGIDFEGLREGRARLPVHVHGGKGVALPTQGLDEACNRLRMSDRVSVLAAPWQLGGQGTPSCDGKTEAKLERTCLSTRRLPSASCAARVACFSASSCRPSRMLAAAMLL